MLSISAGTATHRPVWGRPGPSRAVVFPRLAAVVAELGGELSHAAILLREAGIPAVVNARGACRAFADGERIQVEPARGWVRRAGHPAAEHQF